VSADTLTKNPHRGQPTPPAPTEEPAQRAAAGRHATRVRRLKLHALAWLVGTCLVTTLWVVVERRSNGAFRHFGSQGNRGDWNPTLWALVVGVWGLVVGIRGLRVLLDRPTAVAAIARARRLRFHLAAWALGMLVLTPIWALIEWQDNGAFERFGGASRPGEWEPWILYVGGVWALVASIVTLPPYLRRSDRSSGRSPSR
jgi:amino acid transporter